MAGMIAIKLTSPADAMRRVGTRARSVRLVQNLTQEGLAARAAVSLGSLKLFESTGKASFETVTKIAFALGSETEIEELFPPQTITRIADVMETAPRKRGRRK